MSNDARRTIWNTRERALSDDLNAATDLLVRQIINGIAFQSSPDELASLNFYGVVSGLLVSSGGLALTVTVEIGLALKYDPTAAQVYDSKYRIVEVTTPIVVDLSSYVNPANPRWVVVEIEPGNAVESMALRDIFNPAAGQFVGQAVPKVRRPEPVVTVRAGTPSPGVPAMPLGATGKIPLAYVYLPAGALTVDPGLIVRCRPLLTPRLGEQAQNLIGGGFEVSDDGDSVVLAATSATYRPAFFPTPVQIDAVALQAAGGLDLDRPDDPAWGSGQGYPNSTRPIYLYLMSAPYPEGYDTSLAGREFVPGDQADIAAVIPSYTRGVSGGLLVAALDAPVANQSAIGTHLGLAILGVNDPTWNGGPGASAIVQGRVAYVGAVTFLTGAGGLLAQWCENRSHVRFTTTAPGSESYSPGDGETTFDQLGSFAVTSPMSLLGPRWAPQTANTFEPTIHFTGFTSATWGWSLDVEEFGPPSVPFAGETGVHATTQVVSPSMPTHAGLFRWGASKGVGGADPTLQIEVWGYDDAMLERS